MSTEKKRAATNIHNTTGNNEDYNNCFLLVSIAGRPPQKIVIQLHRQETPQTCTNFAALCQAPGRTSPSKPVPTYRGTIFHRIVPQFMVQGGDFEHFSGSGGYCLLTAQTTSAKTFEDESFVIQHDKAGVVSMANKGKNSNGSQFFITLQPTPHLNSKHVAFGQVVEGMEVVHAMATDVELEGSRPAAMQKIVVVDCGTGKGPGSSSCSDSDSSDNDHNHLDRKKKRRKDSKKSHKKGKKTRKKKPYKDKDDHKRRRKDDDSVSDSDSDSSSTSRPRRERRKTHKKRKHKDEKRRRGHSSSSRRRRDDRSDASDASSSDSDDSKGHGRKKR